RQFVFSTFATTQFASDDIATIYAGTRAHNRAMGAWCGEDDRLIGVAWVPMHDAEAAAAAVDEALGFGGGAIHVPSLPPKDKAPTHPDFDPMWARLADAGVPFVLHLGGQGRMIRPSFHK